MPKLIDNAADKIKQLAELIAENEPQRLEDHITFWERWFNDGIKGSKATIINEIEGKIVAYRISNQYFQFCQNQKNRALYVISYKRHYFMGFFI